MAFVDADYKFLYVDVGCNGRISDGGVFRNSSLSNTLSLNMLNIPLSGSESLPYVVVADDSFPLKTYMMKPYAFKNLCTENRVFNYHLNRAHHVVENAFGILANKYRIFFNAYSRSFRNSDKSSFSKLCFAYFLRTESPHRYTPAGTCDIESIENGEITLENGGMKKLFLGHFNSSEEIDVQMQQYFNTVDRVPWTDKVVLGDMGKHILNRL